MSLPRTKLSWMSNEELLTLARSKDLLTDLEIELLARLEDAMNDNDTTEAEKAELEEVLCRHGLG